MTEEITLMIPTFLESTMLFKEDLITESVGLSLDQLSVAPALNKGKTLYYYVYGGNYPEIVINALTVRGNWQ